MPAVRDVGARFIAARLPACCRLGDIHNLLPHAASWEGNSQADSRPKGESRRGSASGTYATSG